TEDGICEHICYKPSDIIASWLRGKDGHRPSLRRAETFAQVGPNEQHLGVRESLHVVSRSISRYVEERCHVTLHAHDSAPPDGGANDPHTATNSASNTHARRVAERRRAKAYCVQMP